MGIFILVKGSCGGDGGWGLEVCCGVIGAIGGRRWGEVVRLVLRRGRAHGVGCWGWERYVRLRGSGFGGGGGCVGENEGCADLNRGVVNQRSYRYEA